MTWGDRYRLVYDACIAAGKTPVEAHALAKAEAAPRTVTFTVTTSTDGVAREGEIQPDPPMMTPEEVDASADESVRQAKLMRCYSPEFEATANAHKTDYRAAYIAEAARRATARTTAPKSTRITTRVRAIARPRSNRAPRRTSRPVRRSTTTLAASKPSSDEPEPPSRHGDVFAGVALLVLLVIADLLSWGRKS